MYQKQYVFDDAQKPMGFLTYQNSSKEFSIISLYTGDYKKRHYLREISKLSKLALKTTQNILANLEKRGILTSKTEGKNKYFALNLENIQTKFYLLQAEIFQTSLFLGNYPQLMDFLSSIDTNTPLIISGNPAESKAGKGIKLIALSKKRQKYSLNHIFPKLRQLNISESSFVQMLKGQDAIIREILKHHIILNNHSFYVNVMWSYYTKQLKKGEFI